MIKYIITAFLIFSVSADLSVRMSDEDEPTITLRDTDGTTINLFIETSGDGTSESSAFKTYLPIQSTTSNIEQQTYFYRSDLTVPKVDDASAGLGFSLTVDNNSDSSQQLIVAIKVADDTYANISNITSTNFVSYSEICAESDAHEFDCSSFSDNNDEDSVLIYIGYIDDGTEGDDLEEEFNPADSGYDNGIFIELSFSSDTDDYSGNATVVSSLESGIGDSTIYLTMAGTINVENDNRGVALYNTSDSSFREFFELSSLEDTTNLTVNSLENGTSYDFKVAWLDKWGYRSNFSSGTGALSPAPIETVLDKTSCYLITAGFGQEHYVIDYFRSFRDNFLLQTKLGTGLVVLYYATAPEYAKKLYQMPYLRKGVVALSYVLYGFMKYWMFAIIGSILMISLVVLLWKKDLIKESLS